MEQHYFFGTFTESEVSSVIDDVIKEINEESLELAHHCSFKNGDDSELSAYAQKISLDVFDEQDLIRAERLKNLLAL